MRVGFVGVGNMGGAILNGMVQSRHIHPEVIFISGSNPKRLRELQEKHHVNIAMTNRECVVSSDAVFIGVKPEIHALIADEFKEEIGQRVLISMAAKVTIAQLEKIYGSVPIIRIMPNLNVAIRKGITAIIRNQNVSDAQYNAIRAMLETLGDVVEIEEALMSAFISIAGSSPAFVFRFIDQLIQPAIADGMDPDTALHIASIAVSGSADYLKVSEESAKQLIENVSSPNGTTIEGLNVFDELGFDDTIIKAARAVIDKDKLKR